MTEPQYTDPGHDVDVGTFRYTGAQRGAMEVNLELRLLQHRHRLWTLQLESAVVAKSSTQQLRQ